MLIGNHAVLFQGKIAENTEEIISGLKKGGCDGIEVGMRFFGDQNKQELKRVFEHHDILLSAYHVSSTASDIWDHPEAEESKLMTAGAFLQDFSVKNIMYTILADQNVNLPYERWDPRLKEEAALKDMAIWMDHIAEKLEQQGVTLHFHNHNWEFADGGKWFFAIADNTCHLKLGLDIGWTYAAGFDALEILETYRDRIGYVHIRDFKFADLEQYDDFENIQKRLFTDIGEGDVPVRDLLQKLQGILGPQGFVTIEYEFGGQEYERYIRATEYIRSILLSLKE